MPRQSFLPDAPHGAPSQGNGAVAVAGDNYGTINTGVIINIRGDDIEKQREVSRFILAATLLAPPLEPERKEAAARYYRGIARTLSQTAKGLRAGTVPHGKCGEMLAYAHGLSGAIGDVIGQAQAAALADKLLESYRIEHAGDDLGHLTEEERSSKFGLIDEAAGYFRAAARSLQVRR